MALFIGLKQRRTYKKEATVSRNPFHILSLEHTQCEIVFFFLSLVEKMMSKEEWPFCFFFLKLELYFLVEAEFSCN